MADDPNNQSPYSQRAAQEALIRHQHGSTSPMDEPRRRELEHVSAEQIRRVPNRIKGFSGGYLRQSLSALILFWSPSNANFVFC